MQSLLNSPLFSTLVCLVLVYALLSLLVSSITEMINHYYKERGKMLYQTISSMFEDKLNVNFGQLLYDHPVIANLRKDRSSFPQYISPEIFSSAIIDVISNYARVYEYTEDAGAIVLKPDNRNIFERCKAAVLNMKQTDLKLVLINMLDKCDLENTTPSKAVAELQLQMQQWFNAQMDRATGWYKIKTAVRLRWVAFIVAIALNVDSIHVFTTLFNSPNLRAQITPIAQSIADNYKKQQNDTTTDEALKEYKAIRLQLLAGHDNLHKRPDNDSIRKQISNDSLQATIALKNFKKVDSIGHEVDSIRAQTVTATLDQLNNLSGLGVPIGWKSNIAPRIFLSSDKVDFTDWIWYILGIVITALSISMGAPFWFDLLLKFINVRKAGVKPDNTSSSQ